MSDIWDVRFSEEALEDVRAAAEYMKSKLHNDVAARDFIDAVNESLSQIAEFPNLGAPVADFEFARKGYRWCLVKGFMLFYTIDKEQRTVFVERCLYGSSNWRSIVG